MSPQQKLKRCIKLFFESCLVNELTDCIVYWKGADVCYVQLPFLSYPALQGLLSTSKDLDVSFSVHPCDRCLQENCLIEIEFHSDDYLPF